MASKGNADVKLKERSNNSNNSASEDVNRQQSNRKTFSSNTPKKISKSGSTISASGSGEKRKPLVLPNADVHDAVKEGSSDSLNAMPGVHDVVKEGSSVQVDTLNAMPGVHDVVKEGSSDSLNAMPGVHDVVKEGSSDSLNAMPGVHDVVKEGSSDSLNAMPGVHYVVKEGSSDSLNAMSGEQISNQRKRPRELENYFFEFNELRKFITKNQKDLSDVYSEMKKALVSEQSSIASATNFEGSRGAEVWLRTWHDDSLQSVDAMSETPRLLVFGGPCSGKSSLINRLLGEDVLPIGSSLICQAGLTHIVYSQKPFVRFNVGNQRKPRDSDEADLDTTLPAKIRKLLKFDSSEAERQAWLEFNDCYLEVGANCKILQANLGFVEVPSDCVDHRARERLLEVLAKSYHRTIVYVIDSQKGFCNQDREFLLFLRANRPEYQVIFVANKNDYDPVALIMDQSSDQEDIDDEDLHRRGLETQDRKLRLVKVQLERYRLMRQSSVFPLSTLRLRLPLENCQELQDNYKKQYNDLENELTKSLRETGLDYINSISSALYLKAIFAFDAFSRTNVKLQDSVTKSSIRQHLSEARAQVDKQKDQLVNKLTEFHKKQEQGIIKDCEKFDFGPLRLHNRIRNNEVELQYRSQINSYIVNLLNNDVASGLRDAITALKLELSRIVATLHKNFRENSDDRAIKSQWNVVIGIQAAEAQLLATNLQLNIEWEAEEKFITWMWRLVSKKSSTPPVFNSAEWKGTVAKEFYNQINISAVVKKFFSIFDEKLTQVEKRLLSLLKARRKCGHRLRKLLLRDDPNAKRAWNLAQICLVRSDALRNWQNHGPVRLESNSVLQSGLGTQHCLRECYGEVAKPDLHSGTVLKSIGSTCALYKPKLSCLVQINFVVAPLMVALTKMYRLCVLHQAYNGTLKDAVEGRIKYSNDNAFKLLLSLLDICKFIVESKESEPVEWTLQCEVIKVRLNEHEAAAMYDCLEPPLQVKVGHSEQQQQLSPSAQRQRFTSIRYASQDGDQVLFDRGPDRLSSERRYREIGNYLGIAFMILCRGYVDSKKFPDWPTTQWEQWDVDAARKNLEKIAHGIDPTGECFVIESPWVVIANSAFSRDPLEKFREQIRLA